MAVQQHPRAGSGDRFDKISEEEAKAIFSEIQAGPEVNDDVLIAEGTAYMRRRMLVAWKRLVLFSSCQRYHDFG